jgi:hypothetical protein
MDVFLRIFTMTALAMAVTETVTAQNASGLLNTVEVQQLVLADSPQAHARLAKHFIALAERYKADAARSLALARLGAGNPNHPVGADARQRRLRQADAGVAAARTVRAVAAYHQILSIGGVSRRPAGASAFEGGKGAPPPTGDELKNLVSAALAPSAQRELIEYFVIVGRTETSNAEAYARMARMARVSGARNTETTAARYEQLAMKASEAARQANRAAELHRQLAAIG